MRLWPTAFGIALLAALVSPAQAAPTCGDHRALCEAKCTPGFVARFHTGSLERCEASCEPRWQECLKTGVWVDLERNNTGWWEVAPRF